MTASRSAVSIGIGDQFLATCWRGSIGATRFEEPAADTVFEGLADEAANGLTRQDCALEVGGAVVCDSLPGMIPTDRRPNRRPLIGRRSAAADQAEVNRLPGRRFTAGSKRRSPECLGSTKIRWDQAASSCSARFTGSIPVGGRIVVRQANWCECSGCKSRRKERLTTTFTASRAPDIVRCQAKRR